MTDVLVAGAGMSGLVTALTAAERGAKVAVVEKSAAPGGSAALSGGLIWTEPTAERLRERNPLGDPVLNETLVARYDDSIEWLDGLGVQMSEEMSGLFGTGRGRRVADMPGFVDQMVERMAELGVTLRTDTALDSIELDDRARVVGARLRGEAGFETCAAASVVLCTGGFPANPEMLNRYVSPFADRLWLRSNAYSTGDGIDAGMRAGAATSGGMHAFYGHLLPARPAGVTPDKFIPLTQYYSIHAVVVNRHGRRFVDESEADEVTAQALSREPQALGFIIVDQAIRHLVDAPAASGFPNVPRVDEIRRAGGTVIEAADLTALSKGIDEAGGNGLATLETLDDFNRNVVDQPERLPIPRGGARHRIEQAPFLAVPVTPAVTFTEGGLKIDSQCRVKDRSGRPIEGLFAAGADGGGVYHERYAGGLSLSLVFGRIAGEEAAGSLPPEVE